MEHAIRAPEIPNLCIGHVIAPRVAEGAKDGIQGCLLGPLTSSRIWRNLSKSNRQGESETRNWRSENNKSSIGRQVSQNGLSDTCSTHRNSFSPTGGKDTSANTRLCDSRFFGSRRAALNSYTVFRCRRPFHPALDSPPPSGSHRSKPICARRYSAQPCLNVSRKSPPSVFWLP